MPRKHDNGAYSEEAKRRIRARRRRGSLKARVSRGGGPNANATGGYPPGVGRA